MIDRAVRRSLWTLRVACE